MIKLENYEVTGWEAAIRGMRNPMNSWNRSDSFECVHNTPAYGKCEDCGFRHGEEPHDVCTRGDIPFIIGPNDHELMMKLAKGGSVHAKYRRMITVYVDITAPLYWWKEFDTYKVGTVANSCSTMHKITDKEFSIEDFSYEHIMDSVEIRHRFFREGDIPLGEVNKVSPWEVLKHTIATLNFFRNIYIETKDKKYWWQMIQLLPSSYNQKRTVMLNYEVLTGIYKYRRNHKLDEWREFCKWIEQLPYSEIITGTEEISNYKDIEDQLSGSKYRIAYTDGTERITITLRSCKVKDKCGYFHCWEQFADVVAPGATIGSHPGGQFSRLYGIVEFEDGVKRVNVEDIVFIDEVAKQS